MVALTNDAVIFARSGSSRVPAQLLKGASAVGATKPAVVERFVGPDQVSGRDLTADKGVTISFSDRESQSPPHVSMRIRRMTPSTFAGAALEHPPFGRTYLNRKGSGG